MYKSLHISYTSDRGFKNHGTEEDAKASSMLSDVDGKMSKAMKQNKWEELMLSNTLNR